MIASIYTSDDPFFETPVLEAEAEAEMKKGSSSICSVFASKKKIVLFFPSHSLRELSFLLSFMTFFF